MNVVQMRPKVRRFVRQGSRVLDTRHQRWMTADEIVAWANRMSDAADEADSVLRELEQT